MGVSAELLEELLTKQQVDADRIVLKLFQEACRLQRIAQAVDLALKIQKNLVSNSPETVEYGHSLAKTHNSLGSIRKTKGQIEEALQEHKAALKILDHFISKNSSFQVVACDYAATCSLLANILKTINQIFIIYEYI